MGPDIRPLWPQRQKDCEERIVVPARDAPHDLPDPSGTSDESTFEEVGGELDSWVEVEVHNDGGVEERQTGRGLDEEVGL